MSVPSFDAWRRFVDEFRQEEIADAERVLAETGDRRRYNNLIDILERMCDFNYRLIDYIERRVAEIEQAEANLQS